MDVSSQEESSTSSDAELKISQQWSPMSSVKTKHECLQNWSMVELRKLRKHIKTKDLYKQLQNKSTDEVNYVVKYITSEATSLLNSSQKARLKKKLAHKLNCEPLNNWALLLQKSYNLDELRTELADSVRIISEFEDIPKPKSADGIDLHKIYLCMVNALEGRPLPSLNYETQRAFNKCMVKAMHTAKLLRSNLNVDIPSHIAERMKMDGCDDTVCHRMPSDFTDEAIVKELCSQLNYNPLKLPFADVCLRRD